VLYAIMSLVVTSPKEHTTVTEQQSMLPQKTNTVPRKLRTDQNLKAKNLTLPYFIETHTAWRKQSENTYFLPQGYFDHEQKSLVDLCAFSFLNNISITQ